MMLYGSCAALLILHPAPLHRSCAMAHHRCSLRASGVAAGDDDEECAVDSEELERLERCLRVATLEASAEQAEKEKDLAGAIAAYEELLALQPPCSPGLREADAARRALQELLLASARREFEACNAEEGCDVSFIEGELQRAQRLGEDTRRQLAERSLEDLGKVAPAPTPTPWPTHARGAHVWTTHMGRPECCVRCVLMGLLGR